MLKMLTKVIHKCRTVIVLNANSEVMGDHASTWSRFSALELLSLPAARAA
jgi:hypothetical protein